MEPMKAAMGLDKPEKKRFGWPVKVLFALCGAGVLYFIALVGVILNAYMRHK